MKHRFFKLSPILKLLSRKKFDLYHFSISQDYHYGKLFLHLFSKIYSVYRIQHGFHNELLINSLKASYSLNQNQIIRIDRAQDNNIFDVDYDWSEILLILKEGLLFTIYGDRVEVYYGSNISDNELNDLISYIERFKINTSVIRQFHLIQYSKGNFELASYTVKPFDIDIDINYNDDFKETNDLIYSSLNLKGKNGLILLHGKYGSGKTSYLRYLIGNIDRKFIYFPLTMVEALSSPEFLPFISQYPHSVIILEDCESILIPRDKGANNSSAISHLLNLGDGLLSDALSINVICTFNAGIRKIDDAILRKGRLLARYEFKELELQKAQALATKIGKIVKIEHPMTVSDVYNLDEKGFENLPTKGVGFNAA